MIYNPNTKPITDSDSKSCKNCKFHNKETPIRNKRQTTIIVKKQTYFKN